MNVRIHTPRRASTAQGVPFLIGLLLLVVPLTLIAQAPTPGAGQAAARAPQTWADTILQQETYATPPPELADAVLAPRHQNVTLANLSPDKKWFLQEIGDGPVPMSVFSKPFHELGGVFIDYKANRSRALTIRNNVGIQTVSVVDGTTKPIAVPANARISNATWSPDGTAVAYFVHTEDATHVWLTDLATGKPRQITPRPVLATMVSSFEFASNSRQIAVVLVPENRSGAPVEPTAPQGPRVKVKADGGTDRNRLRTFPSLMSSPYELQLLEWHATGQLVLIDVQAVAPRDPKARPTREAASRGVRKVGQPAMVRSLDLSPDGKYVRVTRMTKPFSYIVPVSNFGSIEEVWDLEGKALAKVTERQLDLGVRDDAAPTPDPAAGGEGATQQGRREIAWREDGQGLTFLEQEPAPPGAPRDQAAPGGRGAGARGAGAAAGDEEQGERPQAARRKDRVFQWLPPFDEKSLKVVFESNTRMASHRFSPDATVLFFNERAGQNTVEYAVYLSEATRRYTLARYRGTDIYANPGSLVTTRPGRGGGGGPRGGAGGGGGTVLLSGDGTSVFFQGIQYDRNPLEVAPRAFIDRVAIKTGDKKRIFQSDNNGVSERITAILDAEAGRYVVSRESPTEVAQGFLLEGGKRTPLTRNKDIAPDLTRAPKRRLIVERPDGFKFRVNVTLPPDYREGTRLPALFWFYPREYSTQDEYDRGIRTYDKNACPTYGTRSMHFFVRLGYAVVEPDAPIVGPTGRMNDNYENDLRNSLAAVIDELDRLSIVDRTRLAVGGHSYGAFSTVNALVHTPFFKAGIAGDGAYNRTLTPLGFQSERRDLWEAPHVYLEMSPFLQADHMSGALLMYHGMADQNVGTDPTNSTRLFHALSGLGKTAALYLYPLEDHGPASKETLLDLWARWAAWLDKYVKNPQKPVQKAGQKPAK